jgi:Ni,Fe-hydrogenase maturation factor
MVTVNLMPLLSREHIEPVEELLGLGPALAGDDGFAEAVDEHLGDIVVSRVKPAYKAAERIERVRYCTGCASMRRMLIVDVVRHAWSRASMQTTLPGSVFAALVNQLNHLLRLARALDTHDQSYHSKSLLIEF